MGETTYLMPPPPFLRGCGGTNAGASLTPEEDGNSRAGGFLGAAGECDHGRQIVPYLDSRLGLVTTGSATADTGGGGKIMRDLVSAGPGDEVNRIGRWSDAVF